MEPRLVDEEMAALLLANRWAALALVGDEGPAVSMVAYAVEPAQVGLLFFLSGLAAHTRLMLEQGRAALAITSPDLGVGDPQELPRLTLQGPVDPLDRASAAFATAWPSYAARFPTAVPRLALADFTLFRLSPTAGRYVGGFARALDVHPERLTAAVLALQTG